MKSLFGFLLALLLSGTISAQAQTTPAAHPPHAAKAEHMPADHAPKMEKPAKMAKAKPTMMPGGPGPMKKDGTPDMRYKANRMAKGKM